MSASLQEAAAFLALLARPGDVFELRGLSKGRSIPQVTAGYFDDMSKLAQSAIARSGKDDGVYVTLNPVNPGLLSRAPKNTVRQAGNGDTTSDRDVARRRHLLVDVDPVRPTGISSSEEEHTGAIALARKIATELHAIGWPAPIVADSGNGGHLIYAIDLPVDDDQLVKRVLARMSKLFSAPDLKVDEKVFNPARISKVYGTLTRKGENTEDRPHRLSRLLEHPDQLLAVTRDQLEAFAPSGSAEKPRDRNTSSGDRRSQFSLDTWLADHLPTANEQPWSEGRKWLLPVCPFNDSHNRREAFVVEKHSGMIAAGCLHESCKWQWADLRKLYEPNAYERTNNAPAPASPPDREPHPEVLYQDAEYQRELDMFADRDRDPRGHDLVFHDAKEIEEPLNLITIPQALEELDLLAKAPIYPTPFATLNDAIGFGGLLGTQVYTVAAGTGRGKTSWVAEVAAFCAQTVPVLVASWEMRPGYFVARKAAGVLGVHSNDILRGVTPTRLVLQAMPYPKFFFVHRPSLSRLRRAVDHIAQKFGTPPLVVIDYLQKLADHISRTMARPDARAATTEASESLCDIAETSKSAILAVSAIGRGNNKRAANPRKVEPYELVDVAKESGAVEYDGAGLIVLSLDKQTDGEERVATITLAKARFGREMHIDARYNGRRGSWRDCGPLSVDTTASGPSGTSIERIRSKIATDLATNGPAVSRRELLTRTGGKATVMREEINAMIKLDLIVDGPSGLVLTDAGELLLKGGFHG